MEEALTFLFRNWR